MKHWHANWNLWGRATRCGFLVSYTRVSGRLAHRYILGAATGQTTYYVSKIEIRRRQGGGGQDVWRWYHTWCWLWASLNHCLALTLPLVPFSFSETFTMCNLMDMASQLRVMAGPCLGVLHTNHCYYKVVRSELSQGSIKVLPMPLWF